VSTTDARWSNPLAVGPLDADLLDLFAVQPPAAVIDRLDERVRRTLQTWTPGAARRPGHRPGRKAGIVALLAAALAVGGATGSLQALYMTLWGPFDDPWHRGVELGLSEVVDGYRVTLDRAYADSTRLALAISVVDEERRPGTTQLMAMSAIVTDAAGEYSGMGASSSPDGAYGAVNVAWKVPPALPLPAGPRQFHVVVPFIMVRDDSTPPPDADDTDWTPWHEHAGPWTFDFEVDVDGGTVVTPEAVSVVDGAEVTVSRLIATPSIVRLEMRVAGDLPPGDWAPVGQVRHDGRTLRFVVGSFEADGSFVALTDGGVPDASGVWTVTVDELVGPGEPRLTGPWVMEFSAP
jgi:hypothetical protein